MKVTQYSFGSITIEGTTYTKDVIIHPDFVHSPWWRKEGHLLQIDDLGIVLQGGVPDLIIGTGYNGALKVPDKTLQYLQSRGFTVTVKKTPEAVDCYNWSSDTKHVMAALHLTC